LSVLNDAKGCTLGDKCPYGYVFETSPQEDAQEFAKNQGIPRPYNRMLDE
jgi:hypothetical protein